MNLILKKFLIAALALTIAPLPAFADKTIWQLQEGNSNLSLLGDMRFRYETDHEESANPSKDRDRQRIRLRLGGEFQANEYVLMGARLATMADDDHSTNHDLAIIKGGGAESGFGLDKAFLKVDFKPAWVWFGKNDNVVWDATGLTWDQDLIPEGAGFRVEFGESFKGWVTGGYYMVNETGWAKKDDTMMAYQAGAQFGSEYVIKVAVGGYAIEDKSTGDKEDLLTPGGSASYTHAMIEVVGKEISMKPTFGVQMVSSNVDLAKQIGDGGKSSDKQAMTAYLKVVPDPVTVQFTYWDVGIAGATALGAFTQDDFRATNNYTGWDVSVKGKLFGALSAEARYFYQQVKNEAIKPATPLDAIIGKGKKLTRLQVSLLVQF